jgi:signal transduction histidine kinase
MRLAEFIITNREPILSEWESFARSIAPSGMDIVALRDHANAMLNVIAADLETPQNRQAQQEKSKGRAPIDSFAEATAAEHHGAGRADSGFTLEQMVAEFRALRASVIRLWTNGKGRFGADDFIDLNRFNEAIDQALAESISEYNENIEESKEMFLAILGHDLRTPLGAIQTSATFMTDTGELVEPYHSLSERIARGATRTLKMVGDLLDFTRSRLGGGIPIARNHVKLGRVVRDVVDEVRDAHPDCSINVDSRGDHLGEWDQARLAQAFTNLIANAVQHGAKGTTVNVEIEGDKDSVAVRIHNRGAAIPPDALIAIFHPMKKRSERSEREALSSGPTGSLGLGLYIAERIVNAHGGRIEVESSEAAGTTFTVHLPRNPRTDRADG